jgi:LuxR family maltose regulon positive regulatory protein
MSLCDVGHPRQAALVFRQRNWLRFRGTAISETTVEAVGAQRHIIKRPRLTRLLDETTARIILLVAPAGYGKTTLAREWCEASEGPAAWYQCTPASSDVAALAAGVADAFAPSLAGRGTRLRESVRLTVGLDARPNTLAAMMAEELSPTSALLVLDDFHLVSDTCAADFIELLLAQAHLKALIATRKKPSWATARRILYGEIFELKSHLLAMDHDEAKEVLGAHRAADVSQLLVAAEGWPAVIGLAALTGSSNNMDLHESLYDYFADELLRAVPASLRPQLLTLALFPSLNASALDLFTESGIVSLAVDLGFVSVDQQRLRAFHPLLRNFLVRRALENDADELAAALDTVGDHLIKNCMWDDIIALLDEFPSTDGCLRKLIDSGSADLLRDGRVSTVERLVTMAHEAGLAFPALDLAEAEVAFRKGRHHAAHALAVRATATAKAASPDIVRGLILAGRSAALADNFQRSIQCFEQAYEAAVSPTDKINTLWGQLMAANFLELPDTERILDELIAVSHDSDEAVLRVAMARFSTTCWARGNLRDCLTYYRSSEHVAERSDDALLVSAYLQTLAHVYILLGEYEAALQVADRLDQIIENKNLRFARPVALGTRGYAQFGLGHYAEAALTADRLEHEASKLRDDHCILNARHIKARILLAAAEYQEAVRMCRIPRTGNPAPSVIGEVLVAQGLAYMCLHDWKRGNEALRAARAITRSLEAEGMAVWTEVVYAALQDLPHTRDAVRAGIDYVEATAYVDGFVVAARACPRLVASVQPFEDHLDSVTTRALLISTPHESNDLSPREREVAELITVGLTNREIAKALIISEATVKVHVHHILEKLGARSRVEVARRLVVRDVSMQRLGK